MKNTNSTKSVVRNHNEFEHVKRSMFNNIEKELRLAYANKKSTDRIILEQIGIMPGGSEFITAMSLLCYTEFAGELKYNKQDKKGKSLPVKNFNLFFDDLGSEYKMFRNTFLTLALNSVYTIFRCGLAYEYYIKKSCKIYMCKSNDRELGIGQEQDGTFYFEVETFYHDFKKAFENLDYFGLDLI